MHLCLEVEIMKQIYVLKSVLILDEKLYIFDE